MNIKIRNFDYEHISKEAFQNVSFENAYKLCIAI